MARRDVTSEGSSVAAARARSGQTGRSPCVSRPARSPALRRRQSTPWQPIRDSREKPFKAAPCATSPAGAVSICHSARCCVPFPWRAAVLRPAGTVVALGRRETGRDTLEGTLAVRLDGERPTITGTLAADDVDLSDLAMPIAQAMTSAGTWSDEANRSVPDDRKRSRPAPLGIERTVCPRVARRHGGERAGAARPHRGVPRARHLPRRHP